MPLYFVNRRPQDNGDHEVHSEGCMRLPREANRDLLGWFSSCHEAVQAAKRRYPKVNGCYWCSPECHTS